MIPAWLHGLSVALVSLGFLSAIVVVQDVTRHPQHMWIMNIVWPVISLFGTVFTVWLYYRYGRLGSKEQAMAAKQRGEEPPNKTQTPFPIQVLKGAGHCGSGCCLGDIIAEWLAFTFPAIATWLGWHIVFGEKMYAVWVLDFIFAFFLGIAFQYFTIKPMRQLSVKDGLMQAVKADTLSLTAWQVGMYGFMAFASLWLFRQELGVRLEVNSFEFWFMMQIAMWCGWLTSYPVNWWLLKKGIKEKM